MNKFNYTLYFIFALLLSCRPSVDSDGVEGAQERLEAPQNIYLTSDSPSSDPTPSFLIQGNFKIGNTVGLYISSNCSDSTFMGSVTAQNNTSVSINSLPLQEDGVYNYFTKTTSRSGDSSSCSTSQASYSFQTGETDIVLSLPSSGGANLTPIVVASNVVIGASVFIFKDSGCTALVGSQSFADTTVVEIRLEDNALTNDGPYTFFARQVIGTKQGVCSGTTPPATYILNTKPNFMETISPTPGMNLRPTFRVGNGTDPNGALVPGAEVNLFTTATCDPASQVGGATAAANETSVLVTLDQDLTQDGIHTFWSTQTFDNHVSPCSLVFAQYDLDTSPVISLVTTSPGNDPNPVFNISELRPDSTAYLYEGIGCVGNVVVGSSFSSGTSVNIVTTKSLVLSGDYNYSAKQVLPNGYLSPCSDNYSTYSFEAPKVFFLTPSPNNINMPTIAVAELAASSTVVSLYEGSLCGGIPIANEPTSGNSSITFAIPAISEDGAYYYSTKQDGGANPNECMGSARYELNTRPNSFAMVDPPTPVGNSATPTFEVANIINYASATVTLHNSSNCADAAVGIFTGTGPLVEVEVSVPINSEGPREFFAKQTIAGVTPSCSFDKITYTYDLKPPSVAISGDQFSNNPTPTIIVSGVLDEGTSTIYTGDNGCETLRGSSSPGLGTVRNIVSSPLGASDQGDNIYWAKQEVNGLLSECSTAKAVYSFNSSVGDIFILTDNGALPVATGKTNTPTIQIRNVIPGAFVEIFADSSCTVLRGSGISASSIIDIVSFPLGIEGEHKYYSRQTSGVPGPCSSNFATYTLDTTPNAPTLLTSSPNTILTPTLRVTDIISGAQVKLFLDESCTDLVGEAQAISSQVDVSVSASNPLLLDGSYYFYVRQINSGHISPCSARSNPVYILDTRPNSITILNTPNQTSPVTSWNVITPTVRVGGVEPGATVVLYKDNNCQTTIGTGISQQNFIDMTVNPGAFPADGVYGIFTRQSFRGHTSSCSGNTNPQVAATYVLNTSISISIPGPNPNNQLMPSILASNTAASATVQLFSDSQCSSGNEISLPTLSPGGDTTVQVDPAFVGDGTKDIFAKQVIGGQSSPCSEQISYMLFSAPTIELDSNFSPSPSNNNTPRFILSDLMVEPSVGPTTVTIFDNINCTSPAVAPPVTITSDTMLITIDPIPTEGSRTYYASQTATNVGHISTCSPTGAVYDYNLSPVVNMVTDSPNDILRPTVEVSNVVISANVRLYVDAACSNLVGESLNAPDTEVEITLSADLPADGLYTFYAQQELAGNTSGCSPYFATYELITNDFLIAPAIPKSSDITPDVVVSNIDVGDRITLYFDSLCLLPASTEATSAGTDVTITSDTISTFEVTHVWYAIRKIGAGTFQTNCVGPSLPYELDISPSSITSISFPNPGTDLQPDFQVLGVNDFATVTLYTDMDCTPGNEAGAGNSGPSNSAVINTDPPITQDGDYEVWARQLTNGFLSDCSATSGIYTLDTKPQKLLTITPSPGDNPSPLIRVEGVVSNAQVDLHLGSGCSSAIVGTGIVANGGTTIEINTFPFGKDGTYDFYAKQILPSDPTYVSPCSATSTEYVLDTRPTNLATLTVQPSAQNSPKILVEGVGQGDFVQIFNDPGCTVSAGSNISSGISVTVKTLPVLTIPDTYTFYARRTQSGGLGITSECTGAFANTDFTFDPTSPFRWELSGQVEKDIPTADDLAGSSVTGSEDYLVMGSPGELAGQGRVYFWKYNGFFWESEGSITASDITNGAQFGASLDLYTYNSDGKIANGDLLIVGAPGTNGATGAAYIYTYSNGVWVNEQKLTGSGVFATYEFGFSVAINNFMAVVGVPGGEDLSGVNTGSFIAFENQNRVFNVERYRGPPVGLSAGDAFGYAVSLGGDNLLVSAPLNNRNMVFVYSTNTSAPVFSESFSGGDEFGFSLDLSSEFGIIGAPAESSDQGRAYVYSVNDWTTPIRTLQSMNPINSARFGESVSITNTINNQGSIISNAIVGEPEGELSATSPVKTGQAYIFAGSNFIPVVALPLYNNDANDRVGASVFIFDDNILVGAPGMGPGDSAGAVYIYRNDL